MENILLILVVWFLGSIPASLLIGKILAASNRLQDEDSGNLHQSSAVRSEANVYTPGDATVPAATFRR